MTRKLGDAATARASLLAGVHGFKKPQSFEMAQLSLSQSLSLLAAHWNLPAAAAACV
jgi:hypothetical protein